MYTIESMNTGGEWTGRTSVDEKSQILGVLASLAVFKDTAIMQISNDAGKQYRMTPSTQLSEVLGFIGKL